MIKLYFLGELLLCSPNSLFSVWVLFPPVSFSICVKEGDTAAEGGSEKPGGSGDSEDDEEDDSDEDSDEDSDDDEDDENEDEAEEGDSDEPLSLEWPDTRRKQATYLFLLPIVFPLWLTVPDVRNPVRTKRKHHVFLVYLLHFFTCDRTDMYILCFTGIQEVLCHYLPWLNSMDCYIFLSYGVVGTSGKCRNHYMLINHMWSLKLHLLH